MRVKISYGADLKEVPEEVDQLYTYVSSKVRAMQKQTEQVEDLLAEEDLSAALGLIDRMRKTMTSIDLRLSDIEAITEGYLNHKGERDVQQRRPSLDPTGESSPRTESIQPSHHQNNEGT